MTDIDPFDALPEQQTARRGSGRLLVGALLVIAIFAAFSVTAWFAYNRGFYSASDELAPIVRADDGPTRVRPETPGGLDIPDQDKLVFDRIAPGQAEPTVERLLPEPEQPLPAPVVETVETGDAVEVIEQQATAVDDTVDAAITQGAEAIEDAVALAPPPPPIPGAETATAEPATAGVASAGDAAEPEADGGLDLNDVLAAISNELPGAGDDAPADTTAAGTADDVAALDPPVEATVDSAEAPAVAPPTVESVPIPEPPAVETATATPPPPAVPAAADPAAADPAAAVVPASGDSGWRIQLASVRDEAGAAREWDRLKSLHPDLLGALVLNIQSADLDAGRFYRIQAGPVANRDAARKLCADLAGVNQDCLVVQP